jgi:hypothetical protein
MRIDQAHVPQSELLRAQVTLKTATRRRLDKAFAALRSGKAWAILAALGVLSGYFGVNVIQPTIGLARDVKAELNLAERDRREKSAVERSRTQAGLRALRAAVK